MTIIANYILLHSLLNTCCIKSFKYKYSSSNILPRRDYVSLKVLLDMLIVTKIPCLIVCDFVIMIVPYIKPM